ncbi:MAG: hypothetical protein LQ342_008042 [Letrouitia transgressa]|nr:MAG: hypothetical protein LQ342_008042 [Letrouitia transgressa]
MFRPSRCDRQWKRNTATAGAALGEEVLTVSVFIDEKGTIRYVVETTLKSPELEGFIHKTLTPPLRHAYPFGLYRAGNGDSNESSQPEGRLQADIINSKLPAQSQPNADNQWASTPVVPQKRTLSIKLTQAEQNPASVANRIEPDEANKIMIRNGEAVGDRYKKLINRLPQIFLKSFLKNLLKLIEPKKQSNHPYNGRELTKPGYWPEEDCPHKEPDHLMKMERRHLFEQLLCDPAYCVNMFRKITRVTLRDSTMVKLLNSEGRQTLEEIFDSKEKQEDFFNSRIDPDSTVVVFKEKAAKQQSFPIKKKVVKNRSLRSVDPAGFQKKTPTDSSASAGNLTPPASYDDSGNCPVADSNPYTRALTSKSQPIIKSSVNQFQQVFNGDFQGSNHSPTGTPTAHYNHGSSSIADLISYDLVPNNHHSDQQSSHRVAPAEFQSIIKPEQKIRINRFQEGFNNDFQRSDPLSTGPSATIDNMTSTACDEDGNTRAMVFSTGY